MHDIAGHLKHAGSMISRIEVRVGTHVCKVACVGTGGGPVADGQVSLRGCQSPPGRCLHLVRGYVVSPGVLCMGQRR